MTGDAHKAALAGDPAPATGAWSPAPGDWAPAPAPLDMPRQILERRRPSETAPGPLRMFRLWRST